MISTRVHLIGNNPQLSIIVPIDSGRLGHLYPMQRYLDTLGRAPIEYVAGISSDEIFDLPVCMNAGGNAGTAPCLAFSSTLSYPTDMMIDKTISILKQHPQALVVAMRIDEQEDGSWQPNPYAAGDWFCMTKDLFIQSGGWDLRFGYSGYSEFHYMAHLCVIHRAQVVVLAERMWHPYHNRPAPEVVRPGIVANQLLSMKSGLPLVYWIWPKAMLFRYADHDEPINILKCN